MLYIKREVATKNRIDSIINMIWIQKNDEFHFDICFG